MTAPQPQGSGWQDPAQQTGQGMPAGEGGNGQPGSTWHLDPVTSQPVPGPAPDRPPAWPPDPRPRAPWQQEDEDRLPASGMFADVPPDHPVRWLLPPGKDGGIDLHLASLVFPTDDMPAAEMISTMADRQFWHVVPSGTWHYWNGKYHPADTDDYMRRVVQAYARTCEQALRLIKAQARQVATGEALKARAAAEAKGLSVTAVTKEQDERFDQVMDKVMGLLSPQFRYGKQLLNDPVQGRVSQQLAKMLGTDGSEYDRDKTLVNFSDGTFEMATGGKREHRHADKLTSCLAYEFVAGSWEQLWEACPRYLAAMRRLSGNDGDLLSYNIGVEALGLVSGNPGERMYFRCGGSNMGKSLANTITGMLAGGRWYPASRELIGAMESKISHRHASVLATLQGMTYVTVDETDGDLVIDASILKMMVTSEIMATTELYRGRQRFLPRDWTVVANANTGQMPKIPRLDSGLERRIRVIPVPETDPAGTALTDGYHRQVLAEEGAAITTLLVQTAAGVLTHGLREPPAVTQATEAYFDECDPRRPWLRENIGPAPGSMISSTEAWQVFCRDTGKTWVSQTDFSLFLQARGYQIGPDGRGYRVIQNAKWLGGAGPRGDTHKTWKGEDYPH
jgi:phage/plasmid-associated DNA primase